jgi:hypothetical protein
MVINNRKQRMLCTLHFKCPIYPSPLDLLNLKIALELKYQTTYLLTFQNWIKHPPSPFQSGFLGGLLTLWWGPHVRWSPLSFIYRKNHNIFILSQTLDQNCRAQGDPKLCS